MLTEQRYEMILKLLNEKKSITDWESMTFSDFYKTKKADKSHGKDNENE